METYIKGFSFAFSLLILILGNMQGLSQDSGAGDHFVYVENGRLYHPGGKEVALWGVNLQPMLSWEYNNLMKKAGILKRADVWKEMVDVALDELEIMNCKVWRVHLTPADFTDAEGNLVQTIYLDLLDYTVSEAAKRGIYTYLTLLNHMFNYEIKQSFMQTMYAEAIGIFGSDKRWYYRALLMFDEEYLAYSIHYIQSLLTRENPYSGIPYSADTSIAVLEIMNEPSYLDYGLLKQYTEEYDKYRNWLSDEGLTEENGTHYPVYRKQRVLGYINGMYDAIRNAGALQPVTWNSNWHRYINGREDVFEAIAESKVEVISFSIYPGQDETTSPYWDNPINLTGFNFTQWFKQCYEKRDWYGWVLEERFAGKAKIVYEFETFYNQSAYLYPVMADFMRSMGVQVATMWHYSFSKYAPRRNGSHILNLKCTPRKAASFVVASKIFENTPILKPYHSNSTTEWVDENFMYSYRKNLSIFSSQDEYVNSGTLFRPESPEPNQGPKRILGYGSSPLVKYCGSGIYDIQIDSNQISLHIEPNSGWLRPPWGQDRFRYLVTELDFNRPYLMELRLDGWDNQNCSLFRMENGDKVPKYFQGKRLRFVAEPGDYHIERH